MGIVSDDVAKQAYRETEIKDAWGNLDNAWMSPAQSQQATSIWDIMNVPDFEFEKTPGGIPLPKVSKGTSSAAAQSKTMSSMWDNMF